MFPLRFEAAPVKEGGGVGELEDGGPEDDGVPIEVGMRGVELVLTVLLCTLVITIGEQDVYTLVAATLDAEGVVMTWERSTLVGVAPETGGTEMAWPAWEHWETTTLETALFE